MEKKSCIGQCRITNQLTFKSKSPKSQKAPLCIIAVDILSCMCVCVFFSISLKSEFHFFPSLSSDQETLEYFRAKNALFSRSIFNIYVYIYIFNAQICRIDDESISLLLSFQLRARTSRFQRLDMHTQNQQIYNGSTEKLGTQCESDFYSLLFNEKKIITKFWLQRSFFSFLFFCIRRLDFMQK